MAKKSTNLLREDLVKHQELQKADCSANDWKSRSQLHLHRQNGHDQSK